MIVPVILCGGGGTRLWPLSTERRPKQFLTVGSDRSLLQQTVLRFADSSRFSAPLVVCHEDHHALVEQHLDAVGCRPAATILEPARRNTAPAAAMAALVIAERDPTAIIVMAPSDHLIAKDEAFGTALSAGLRGAADGRFVALGIQPDRPHTGYGYILAGEALADRAGCFAIDRFVEKPDLETARHYLASGRYLWNAGIFLFRADRLLEEMETTAPEIVPACHDALPANRPTRTVHPDRAKFEACPSQAFDRAVMERTGAGAVVPCDIGWRDVGSWPALWETLDRDGDGNVIVGPVEAEETSDCYLHSDGVPIRVNGLHGCIAVATADGVVVRVMDRECDDTGPAGDPDRQGPVRDGDGLSPVNHTASDT